MVAYIPPTGATDPNAPYVDKNLAAGIQGSAIPAAVVEIPQREMVALVVEAGLTPTNLDRAQIMRAVRSGGLMTYADVGVTNSIVLTSRATKHTAYTPGQMLCVRLTNNITGATQINLDGLGNLPVVYLGGMPLQRFDFLSGDLIVGFINTFATAFVVVSPINQSILDTSVIKSVHGTGADFPDLNAAIAWLNRRRIASTGTVVFQSATGVGANKFVYTTNILFGHPDGARVTIQGQPLSGALPGASGMVLTGTGTAARASDTTQNLAILRNKFNTEIYFQGGCGFIGTGQLGNLNNILFTADGTGNVDVLNWQVGLANFTNVAAVGGGYRGIVAFNARIALQGNCYALGNLLQGMTAESGGVITLLFGSATALFSNGGKGAFANAGTISPPGFAVGNNAGTLAASGNGDDGACAANGGTLVLPPSAACNGNLGCGFSAVNNGYAMVAGTSANNNGSSLGSYNVSNARMDAQNTGGSGSAYGYQAVNGGFLNRQGGAAVGSVATASPPVGQTGNNNATIV